MWFLGRMLRILWAKHMRNDEGIGNEKNTYTQNQIVTDNEERKLKKYDTHETFGKLEEHGNLPNKLVQIDDKIGNRRYSKNKYQY